MSRFNPRLIAVVLFVVAGYAAFHFSPAKPETKSLNWREFAASKNTKVTALALLGRGDDYGKSQQWYKAQPKFHDEIVLSQMPVKDAEICHELRQIFAHIVPGNIASACEPNYRHALRFEKNGRTVDAVICFGCGQIGIIDSAGKGEHFDFSLPYEKGRDQFDTIFARLGMKQFKPYAQSNES